jgi:hypothetical protein
MKQLVLLVTLAGIAASMGCTASVRAGDPAYAREPTRVQRVDTRWVTIADRYSADSNRQFINLRGQEAYRRIRIEASRGAPVIKQVGIEYADSRDTQVIRIDERLAPGQGRTIDLHGGRRPIQRIIVYTQPEYGGAYSVYGA